jgi:hypothetical protein
MMKQGRLGLTTFEDPKKEECHYVAPLVEILMKL